MKRSSRIARRNSSRSTAAIRRFHGLHRVSEVQVHPCQDARDQVPEVRGRRRTRGARREKGRRRRVFYGCNKYPACTISLRRTNRSPSPARSAARRSLSRSAARWALCAPALKRRLRLGIGGHAGKRRNCQQFPSPSDPAPPEEVASSAQPFESARGSTARLRSRTQRLLFTTLGRNF